MVPSRRNTPSSWTFYAWPHLGGTPMQFLLAFWLRLWYFMIYQCEVCSKKFEKASYNYQGIVFFCSRCVSCVEEEWTIFGGVRISNILHIGPNICVDLFAGENVLVHCQVGSGNVILKRRKSSLIHKRSSCLIPLGTHILVVSDATTRIFIISTAPGRRTRHQDSGFWGFFPRPNRSCESGVAVNRNCERGVSEKKISRRL